MSFYEFLHNLAFGIFCFLYTFPVNIIPIALSVFFIVKIGVDTYHFFFVVKRVALLTSNTISGNLPHDISVDLEKGFKENDNDDEVMEDQSWKSCDQGHRVRRLKFTHIQVPISDYFIPFTGASDRVSDTIDISQLRRQLDDDRYFSRDADFSQSCYRVSDSSEPAAYLCNLRRGRNDCYSQTLSQSQNVYRVTDRYDIRSCY